MDIKHIKYWISSITLILIANLVLMWLLKLQTIENNLTLILGLTAIIAASVVTLKVAPIAQIGGAPGDKDAYQLKEKAIMKIISNIFIVVAMSLLIISRNLYLIEDNIFHIAFGVGLAGLGIKSISDYK